MRPGGWRGLSGVLSSFPARRVAVKRASAIPFESALLRGTLVKSAKSKWRQCLQLCVLAWHVVT